MKRHLRANQKRPHRQRGATAIEFSIVFALLFGTFWAILSYAMPFFLLQVMNRASAESARFAIRAESGFAVEQAAYEAKVVELAGEELARQLEWLPPSFRNPFEPYAQNAVIATDLTTGGRYLIVRLAYVNYGSNPIIPVLRFPGVGSIPNIPGSLIAESRMRLSEL